MRSLIKPNKQTKSLIIYLSVCKVMKIVKDRVLYYKVIKSYFYNPKESGSANL